MRETLRRTAVAALTAVLLAVRLAAQAPPGATARERELLARGDSLYAQLEARRTRAEQAQREEARGRLTESGGLAMVVAGTVPVAEALRALDSARVVLAAFGGVPEAFSRSVVVVFQGATDTGLALGAASVRDRRRVLVTGIQQGGAGPGWATVVGVIARAYRASLDPDWRAWLPWDFGVGGWDRAAAWAAFWSLTRSPWAVSTSCLAAAPAGCRLWLGVDRDAAPFEARYTGAELRRSVVEDAKWFAERSESGRSCLEGADAACFAFVRETRFASPFPADEMGRRSVIRAVQALHGPRALARALADTAGGVGERLARAAGIGEDSLMLEWRYWVLTRGGRPADRGVVADAAPALLLAGLLLAVARRSRA